MKNFNMKKSLAALALVGAASSATAADITANIAFTTLPEITITQIRALAYGNVLSLTTGALCTMSSSAGTEALTEAQTGLAGGASAGQLSGACDNSANGTVGIYEITSFADASVSVTLSKGTATEIDFTPAGHVIDYNGATAADAIASGTALTVEASASGDVEVGNGTILTGKNRVLVGGTIQNTQALTANGDYTTDFEINVVYN